MDRRSLCLKEFRLESLNGNATGNATGTRYALPEPVPEVNFCLARVSVDGVMIDNYKGINPPVMVGLGVTGVGTGNIWLGRRAVFGVDIWG